MSWMQLLATSRSIAAAKDGPTRYKMAEQNLLPKFSPPRRGAPAASLEASEISAAAPAKAPLRASQLETPSLFDFNPGFSKIARKTPPPAASMATTRGPEIGEPARMEEEPAGTVAKKILPAASNPFVASAASKSKKSRWSLFETLFVRRRRKQRNGELVQGIWVLDQVTVVRNDLSDADLEVVAGKAAVREVLAVTVSKRERMTQALARFTTRFQIQRKEREETGAAREEIKYPEMAVHS